MELSMEIIRSLCTQNKIIWTSHALVRLIQREISRENVKEALIKGKIIEQYPQDYPHPSCLILALDIAGAALHVVCGATETNLWIITAYRPNLKDWEDDFMTRRGGKR